MTHPDRYDLDLPPDDIDTRMSGSNHGAGNNPPRRCIMFPSRMLRSIAPILLPLLCASAVVAVMSASLAAEETPTCQGNALHCEFLASFHTYARLWDVMEKKGAPESLKTAWEAVLGQMAIWLEVEAERVAVYSLVLSDEYQDLVRGALTGDKAVAMRLETRGKRVLTRVEALVSERAAVAEEMAPLLREYLRLLNEWNGQSGDTE